MGCIIWLSLSILFSLSFSKRQREKKRMEVKLPKMQLSFLSLFYNSLFIFTLLIDCWCVPRDQLYCITGTEAFHDVLLALVGRGPMCCRLTFQALGCLTPSKFGTGAPFPVAMTQRLVPSGAAGSQSSSLNLFVLRPLWNSTEKVRQAYGQCILVCYQRRLKPEVTWLSFPCLFCWAVAFRLPQVPTKISEEEQFIKFPWLGL